MCTDKDAAVFVIANLQLSNLICQASTRQMKDEATAANNRLHAQFMHNYQFANFYFLLLPFTYTYIT